MTDTRSTLYRAARLLGDAQAASRGPAPLAKRYARKAVYRRTNSATRSLLKGLGLSR